MSDSDDPFESNLLGKVRKNRRAVKRKAENQADREIMDLIEKRERLECEKQSDQSALIDSKNDEMFNDNGLQAVTTSQHEEKAGDCTSNIPAASTSASNFNSNLVFLAASTSFSCDVPSEENLDKNFSESINIMEDPYSGCEGSNNGEECESSNDEDDDEGGAHHDAFAHLYLPLLSVAHFLKNRQTKSSLSTHLKIQQIATGSKIKELTSVHNLLSKYKKISKGSVTKVHVCRKKTCSEVLQVDSQNKPLFVQSCGHNNPETQGKRACYVLNLSIEQQLAHFIRQHGLPSNRNVDENVRSDVNSGKCYRQLREQGLIDDDTVTLQLNTDGVQKFKTSNYSFWPLMAMINEVPYHIRRTFIILIALWFGNRKPPRNVLMDRPIEELQHLQDNGFMVDGKKYKLRVLILTTDTMARPVLKNTTQFNAAFGCDWCLLEGKIVKKGKGHTRVYCEPRSKSGAPKKRTLEQHVRDVQSAVTSGKPVHGVAGPTPLSDLTGFDFVQACVPDYLHAVCLGVFKHFIQLFTSSDWKKNPWFIGKKEDIETINRRLASSRPPYEIKRTLDDIADLTDWKASMYRSFTLYHFQLLEGILPSEYFRHYADVVYGITALLQKEVSAEDVRKVDVLLRRFVIDMERLYGKEHIRINVHFLTHLAECVINWGCLWATSNFIPEGFNGELKNLANGTAAVVEQMAENYLMLSEVRREAVDLIHRYDLPHSVVKLLKELLHLPDSLIGHITFTRGESVNDGTVKLLGTPMVYSCTIEEEVALLNLFSSDEKYNRFFDLNLSHCYSYQRFQLDSPRSIFTTTSYKRSQKSVNYCALLKNGEFVFIERILFFHTGPNRHSFFTYKTLGTVSKKVYTPEPIDDIVFTTFPGQTTKLFGVSKTVMAADYKEISSKCILSYRLPSADLYVATGIVNPFETD